MTGQDIEIRQAVPDDTALILSFISELADYEKLADAVVADEALLQQTLFGEDSTVEVVIATSAGNPAGFALYFTNFSTFLGRPGIYLEDLFVRPEFRGQGIGKKLLTHLAATAEERNCGRLEWAVLDWNRSAIGFYESIGAEAIQGWTIYRLTGDTLAKLAQAK